MGGGGGYNVIGCREIYVKLLNQCVGYLQHFQIPGQIVPVQRRRGIHGTFAVGKHIDVRIQLKVIGQIYGDVYKRQGMGRK